MAARGPVNTSAPPEVYASIVEGLKRIYKEKVKPVEQTYLYDKFFSPFLTDADIQANPTVMLLGQYSTGKTSFIRYLVGKDFPGMNIGPEPTTDRFVAVMYGDEDRVTPGNAAAVSANLPFGGLQAFGNGFLSKFEVSQSQAQFLENVTIIDTPGVLSGEKQRIGRSYDFVDLCQWFADRSDIILLLFDAHKLDISDEFKRAISTLRGHDDKIRVVLNKADTISKQQLMRVYGALMWSLGKVFDSPEVKRVYIGSFWERPCQNPECAELFAREQSDLLHDLREMPANAAVRKVNEFVKRIRLVRTHALIISHLKNEMPSVFGKEKKQKELIDTLAVQFNKVHRANNIPVGDFPELTKYAEQLKAFDFNKFPKFNPKIIKLLDDVMAFDVPQLMEQYTVQSSFSNPFQNMAPAPEAALPQGPVWTIKDVDKAKYDNIFATLAPENGLASADKCKAMLMKSKLAFDALGKIWNLSDIDQDGMLDADEFAVAMHLTYATIAGAPIPDGLDAELIPPSKRAMVEDDGTNPFAEPPPPFPGVPVQGGGAGAAAPPPARGPPAGAAPMPPTAAAPMPPASNSPFAAASNSPFASPPYTESPGGGRAKGF